MKTVFRIAAALTLVTVLHLNLLPTAEACGPSYLSPVFDYSYAPERPWTDFAGGKLGIIKPDYKRVVLFGAYRYLNGSGFTADEQKALVEAWEAQFNRKEPEENNLSNAVKEWLRERKNVAGEEEKVPEMYTERRYEDKYDFFPNCSKNAFEVAAKTLADRALSYGSDSKDVKEWLAGQDQVFTNCADGKAELRDLGPESPEWLRKDRDYQSAAAAFYAVDYENARKRFENIAADNDSPWQNLADYLVARTLVRQASVGEDDGNSAERNKRAEDYLIQLIGRTTTYQNDTRRLLNLVKYRLHPEERVRELAQKLPYQNDGAELRQDLIDYTWLLDQLESEALKKEEDRKEALKPPDANVNSNRTNSMATGYAVNSSASNVVPAPPFVLDNSVNSAVRAANTTMSAAKSVQPGYNPSDSYKGGYYGPETLSLSILPPFLGDDPLSEWLFTFQMQNDEAYFHAFRRWKETSSEMWLMTAITKAGQNRGGLKELMDAAKLANPDSPAYYTIAYHQVRLLLDDGKKDEARKLLAKILDEPRDMPISTRNLFTKQRLKVAETLSEFIKCSLRKPFGFSYEDDTARSIDEIIAERKSWFNQEYEDTPQAEFDLNIEKEFAEKKLWQDRMFFDDEVVDIINNDFPTSVMLETLGRPELPDYLKRRLTLTIWARAYLLKDEKTTLALAPEVVKIKPGVEPLMAAYINAKTRPERETAGLFLLLKTGDMSPYLQSGFDPDPEPQFDMWQDERWWCEQYDYNYDDAGTQVPKAAFMVPFLTKELSDKARLQKAALKKTGDGLSYMSGRVMEWAATGVPDRRLPEALYLIFQANQWVKYSCGTNSEEVRAAAGKILRTRYPRSKWTAQMFEDLKEQ